MAYQPRPTTPVTCAYCAQVFAARHVRRRYCSKSCNVRASYARTGRRGQPAGANLPRAVAPLPPVPMPHLAPVAQGSPQPPAQPSASAAFCAEMARIYRLVEHARLDSQRRQQQCARWLDEMAARWEDAPPRQRSNVPTQSIT
jgi:hypothetical protein